MNIFISADMEGVAGVVHKEHTARGGKEHERARQLMTEEVNAAIQGSIDQGAEKILVNDSHGTMRNIYPESLLPEANLISGSIKKLGMMEGIRNGFDAVLFIGYHTKMGSNGILSHTFSGTTISSILINGKEMGEFGINALIGGYFGIPVIFVSGCDKTIEEARSHVPDIYAAEVKRSITRTTAENLHPQKARHLIRSSVTSAIENYEDKIPFNLDNKPLRFEIRFLNTELADAVGILPFINRKSPLSVEYTASNVIEGYRVIRSLILMCRGVIG